MRLILPISHQEHRQLLLHLFCKHTQAITYTHTQTHTRQPHTHMHTRLYAFALLHINSQFCASYVCFFRLNLAFEIFDKKAIATHMYHAAKATKATAGRRGRYSTTHAFIFLLTPWKEMLPHKIHGGDIKCLIWIIRVTSMTANQNKQPR